MVYCAYVFFIIIQILYLMKLNPRFPVLVYPKFWFIRKGTWRKIFNFRGMKIQSRQLVGDPVRHTGVLWLYYDSTRHSSDLTVHTYTGLDLPPVVRRNSVALKCCSYRIVILAGVRFIRDFVYPERRWSHLNLTNGVLVLQWKINVLVTLKVNKHCRW